MWRIFTKSTSAAGNWFSVLLVVTAETIGDRYRRSKLGAALAILEPLGLIALFSWLHSQDVGRPPFGTSSVLFYSTGVLPFYLFFYVSWRLRAWDTLRRVPGGTRFDLLLVQMLSELISKTVIIAIVNLGLWLYGIEQAVPRDPLLCLGALISLMLLGAAVGIVNAVIGGFFFSWFYIYAILMRAWMAFSGVLFVVDQMPPKVRDIALYVPMTHAVTLYRDGQYSKFPVASLDVHYLLVCTIVGVLMSFVLESATREWRPIK